VLRWIISKSVFYSPEPTRLQNTFIFRFSGWLTFSTSNYTSPKFVVSNVVLTIFLINVGIHASHNYETSTLNFISNKRTNLLIKCKFFSKVVNNCLTAIFCFLSFFFNIAKNGSQFFKSLYSFLWLFQEKNKFDNGGVGFKLSEVVINLILCFPSDKEIAQVSSLKSVWPQIRYDLGFNSQIDLGKLEMFHGI